jgi:hypothetical protein
MARAGAPAAWRIASMRAPARSRRPALLFCPWRVPSGHDRAYMDDKTLLKADFFSSIGLILFGALVLVESWNMPRFEEQGRNFYTAPGLVPGLLGLLFLLLGGVMFVRSIRRGGHRLRGSGAPARGYLSDAGNRRFLMALGLCLLYSLGLIGVLPYALATGIFIALFIVAFEYEPGTRLRSQVRTLATAALQAVLVAVAVTYVFQELFLVNLP